MNINRINDVINDLDEIRRDLFTRKRPVTHKDLDEISTAFEMALESLREEVES